jgi:uncharacterized CHY-type Zn-finger protein
MTTYATRLTTVLGAGVDRVRRWSQGSSQEEQHQQRSAIRFATTSEEEQEQEQEQEEAISDSSTATPPHSPTTNLLAPTLEPRSGPEGRRRREGGERGGLEDTASEETLVIVESPATLRPPVPVIDQVRDTDATAATMPSPEGPANSAATATARMSPQSARNAALPEDDGQRRLRQKLSDITRSNLPERERARKMHQVMTEKWNASRASKVVMQQVAGDAQSPSTPTSPTLIAISDDPGKPNPYKLLPGDSDKTYYTGPGTASGEGEAAAPPAQVLGCSHYRRGVRLQCSTCERWHTCRFCHDENEDHALVRRETKNMLCMHCGRPQPAQQDCRFCGVRSAKYYCDKVPRLSSIARVRKLTMSWRCSANSGTMTHRRAYITAMTVGYVALVRA